MQAAIPDCRLVEIEGGGHWAFREQPDRFFEAVDAFLRE
jgi:pimeloyl-ACP methyl ester carboxylesterase